MICAVFSALAMAFLNLLSFFAAFVGWCFLPLPLPLFFMPMSSRSPQGGLELEP